MADRPKKSIWYTPEAWAERGSADILPMRPGMKFFAGPFATAEEAHAALLLAVMPAQGNA
jgi:hypothetical protein